MLWQPRHMAILACSDAGLEGSADLDAAAAGAEAAGVWACANPVADATSRAKSVVNNLFILRAQSTSVRYSNQPAIIGPHLSGPDVAPSHEIPRLAELRRHAGPDAGGQRFHHAQAPAPG